MRKPISSSQRAIDAVRTRIGSKKMQEQPLKKTIFYRVRQLGHNPTTDGGMVTKIDFTNQSVIENRAAAFEYYNALESDVREARAAFIHEYGLSNDTLYFLSLSFVEGEPLHEGKEVYLSGYMNTEEEHIFAKEIERDVLKALGYFVEFDTQGNEEPF